jgi:beta-lactamase class A
LQLVGFNLLVSTCWFQGAIHSEILILQFFGSLGDPSVPKSKEKAVSEYARKPLSTGQRRQLLKQRRQAAQRQVRQQLEPLKHDSPSQKSLLTQRKMYLSGHSSAEGLSSLRTQRQSRGNPTATLNAPLNATFIRGDRLEPINQARIEASRRPSTRSARKNRRPQRKSGWIKNLLRLTFLGLGISAMTGTAIALLHPSPPSGTFATSKSRGQNQGNGLDKSSGVVGFDAPPASLGSVTTLPVLNPEKELKDVKARIQTLASAQKDLVAGLFFYNPETGAYIDVGGDKAFSAASTIKLPVLVAFFQAVDAGQVRLDETLVMRKDLVASESGVMQYQPVGTKFSALETADYMITISDNTATNMLIDRLGGIAALNQRFKSWGLNQINLRNPLPDLQGTNTVTPKDLSTLMLKIGQGDLLTPRSRDLALDIMRRTVTKTLLPPGLGEGSTISHKTGDIASVVGDSGLIGMPNGQRYVATIFVKRPHNDPRAQELIRQISKLSYQALSTTSRSAPPAATTAQALPQSNQ